MCGIAAAIGWDDAEATVRRLLKDLAHRGDVDDPVVSPLSRTALGTRRLRIVDAARAVQPQASFDGRILVCFNGEIYNHAELRRELEAKGVVFRTESDTEVIASGLRIFGPKLLERLNGMYAFVALDAANGEFLAARDPFGVKPLYLIQSGPRYLFSSEMRPLLAATIQGDALLLPPGHLLTRNAVLKFAAAPGGPMGPRIDHDPKKLDPLLAAAVHRRLPPDLPCALMFSGGIDSTLVAHYARQIRPDIAGYFLGDESAPDYRYAALYAQETSFDLRRVPFGLDNMASRIGEVVATAETFEPSVVRDGLCTYLISERIAQDGYRVALSGEGADELFAGYAPLELAFADSDEVGVFVRDQCLLDMHRTNLQRLDRCSMRFGLEAREPFLDPGVVDYALRLGGADMIGKAKNAPQGKAALRSLWSVYPGEIPEAIRDRRKSPLHIGSGFDRSQKNSPWIDYAEEAVSDADFAEGQKRFARFDLRSKEELLYLMKLAECFDVFRVPHLTARPRLRFPAAEKPAAIKERLSDFLVEA